jgi:bifunctional DNA-binding transcriptional regulator/antitoxin component of YhaV-PrlF toxin-antitoxin module
MIISMLMKRRMKISKGGQVSIPASIRKRWETSTLTLDDQGDRIVFTPAPDDPIAAAAGAFAGEGLDLDLAVVRREEREAEQEIEERKWGL